MYKKKTRSIEFGFIYFDFIHSEPVKLIMNRCFINWFSEWNRDDEGA